MVFLKDRLKSYFFQSFEQDSLESLYQSYQSTHNTLIYETLMVYHLLLYTTLFIDRLVYNPKKFNDIYFIGVLLVVVMILYIRYKLYLTKERKNTYLRFYSVFAIIMSLLGIFMIQQGSQNKIYTHFDVFIVGMMIGSQSQAKRYMMKIHENVVFNLVMFILITSLFYKDMITTEPSILLSLMFMLYQNIFLHVIDVKYKREMFMSQQTRLDLEFQNRMNREQNQGIHFELEHCNDNSQKVKLTYQNSHCISKMQLQNEQRLQTIIKSLMVFKPDDIHFINLKDCDGSYQPIDSIIQNIKSQLEFKTLYHYIEHIYSTSQSVTFQSYDNEDQQQQQSRYVSLDQELFIILDYNVLKTYIDDKEPSIDIIGMNKVQQDPNSYGCNQQSKQKNIIYRVKLNSQRKNTSVSQHYVTLISLENEFLIQNLRTRDKMKDQLLGQVSHDLRVPLYCSSNFISKSIDKIHQIKQQFSVLDLNTFRECEQTLVCNDNLVKDMKQVESNLQISLNNQQLLEQMINDILDYSQIIEGKLRGNYSRFKLSHLVKEIKNLMQFQYDQKRIELRIKNYCDKKLIIFNDKKHITQTLFNLLSNSLKFTRKGYVEIKLNQIKGHQNNNLVEFTVKDSGIGMNKEQLQNIAKAFYTSSSQNMNPEGVGLGLFNCNKYLKLFRKYEYNKFEVKSKQDHGTQFQFLIDQTFDTNDQLNQSINLSVSSDESDHQILQHNNFYAGRQSKVAINSIDNESFNILDHQKEDGSIRITGQTLQTQQNQMNIMIVDDQPYSHLSLKLLLSNFEQTKVNFISAYDGQQDIQYNISRSKHASYEWLLSC